MHELSICERVVDLMERQLEPYSLPAVGGVVSVRLVVGALHQIVDSLLQDAYVLLTQGGPAAGSVLEIVRAPVVGRCSACGWKGEVPIPRFRCDACGAIDLDLVGGKELYLESIEVCELEGQA